MEILIKAKQSNNPQFEFLNLNSRLNPFYKHALQSMQNNTYPFGPPPAPESQPSSDNGNEDSMHSSESSMSAYFRPSSAYTAMQVPTIKYKPSADCAYTQLISKIKGTPLPSALDIENGASMSPRSIPDADTRPSSGTSTPNPLAETVPPLIDPEKAAKTLKSIASGDGVEVKTISTGLLLAQYYNSDSETDHDEEDGDAAKSEPAKAVVKPTAAAHHALVAATPVDETKLDFPCPPEELRNIIDKTAAYVLKNGKEFEDILRAKNDQRFTFLHYADQYNSYYVYKLTGMVPPPPPVVTKPPLVNHSNGPSSSGATKLQTLAARIQKPSPAKTSEPTPMKAQGECSKLIFRNGTGPNDIIASFFPGPVSFAIKPKDEQSTSSIRPALRQSMSDDENDGPTVETKRSESERKSSKQPLLLPIKNVSALIREAVMPAAPAPPSFKTDLSTHNSNSHAAKRCDIVDDLNDSSIRDAIIDSSAALNEKKRGS